MYLISLVNVATILKKRTSLLRDNLQQENGKMNNHKTNIQLKCYTRILHLRCWRGKLVVELKNDTTQQNNIEDSAASDMDDEIPILTSMKN